MQQSFLPNQQLQVIGKSCLPLSGLPQTPFLHVWQAHRNTLLLQPMYPKFSNQHLPKRRPREAVPSLRRQAHCPVPVARLSGLRGRAAPRYSGLQRQAVGPPGPSECQAQGRLQAEVLGRGAFPLLLQHLVPGIPPCGTGSSTPSFILHPCPLPSADQTSPSFGLARLLWPVTTVSSLFLNSYFSSRVCYTVLPQSKIPRARTLLSSLEGPQSLRQGIES